MLRISKIFHFETAHAISDYQGTCKNIHGHSYQLEVTVADIASKGNDFIAGPGFVIDFKELKQIVSELINETFEHKLILSKKFLEKHQGLRDNIDLVIWDIEPTAENMLIFLSRKLTIALPPNIKLTRLKLFETKDSFAEWER